MHTRTSLTTKTLHETWNPTGKWIIRVLNERTRGLGFSCKAKVKLLPVVGAVADGMPENEWKWNTTNKNVLSNSNTLSLVSSIFVRYKYHTTKPFFPLVFLSFSFFTSKTYKLKKSNNSKTRLQAIYTFAKSRSYTNKRAYVCSKRNAYC